MKALEAIRGYLTKRQETYHQNLINAQKSRIERTFRVEERNGEIYIVCEGVAVKQFGHETTVAEILADVKVMREAGMSYEITEEK